MTKFDGPLDPGYKKVSAEIARFAKVAGSQGIEPRRFDEVESSSREQANHEGPVQEACKRSDRVASRRISHSLHRLPDVRSMPKEDWKHYMGAEAIYLKILEQE